MHGKHFAVVLLPGLDREFIQADVEELDGAVSCCYQQLVFMDFGPGKVVEGVLGVVPAGRASLEPKIH